VEQYCRLEWALEECGRRGTEGKGVEEEEGEEEDEEEARAAWLREEAREGPSWRRGLPFAGLGKKLQYKREKSITTNSTTGQH
jgi:hypothetical protein